MAKKVTKKVTKKKRVKKNVNADRLIFSHLLIIQL